jgi:putative membrane protein
MHLRSCLLIAALAGQLISVDSILAQRGQTNTENEHMDEGIKKMMTSSETMFAMKAAQAGIAEVKLGQLAVTKASNADVKAFGQKMVEDHTRANEQLKSIAVQNGMTLPTTMNAKDQTLYDKLSNESGAHFDRAYMRSMVKDHEQDIKIFNKEARGGKNPQLKQFARQTTPTLEGHLQMAKATEAK